MDKIRLAAVCAFGLEAVVKRELQKLGYENLETDNGWIYFDAELKDIAITNVNLRSAERVMLVLGQFEALSFEELFNKTFDLPWEEWINVDGKFTVKGKSVKSKLFSVPDCQSIVKKAVVKKLAEEYDVEWFSESGAEFTILVSIHKDIATLSMDTTGSREGLFKRGYRENSASAPLKETMAAALLQLSFWNKDRILLDPMCGSGTIPIEAAMIGRNIAPGLNRSFASEGWNSMKAEYFEDAKTEARNKIDLDSKIQIYGYDINRKAIAIAKQNAIEAGVDDCIEFEVKDINSFTTTPFDYGILITNPPYGERIGNETEIEEIHKTIGRVFGKNPSWSNYVITSEEDFEKHYGKKCDKKRKLFNGDIKVNYYQYFGKRPE
jgi:putative N6-adenine-specific DNA methylase